jgi:predicted transcriptional regulator
MKYRSRTEIVQMILNSVMSGATKSKIMYKAYLSYNQLMEYLPYMKGNDLISCDELTHLYKITEKGIKYLHAYAEIDEMILPNKRYQSMVYSTS